MLSSRDPGNTSRHCTVIHPTPFAHEISSAPNSLDSFSQITPPPHATNEDRLLWLLSLSNEERYRTCQLLLPTTSVHPFSRDSEGVSDASEEGRTMKSDPPAPVVGSKIPHFLVLLRFGPHTQSCQIQISN